MEADLQPYQFLETDYNKETFTLTNKNTMAKYNAPHGGGWLAMTRPIGRDHRLILKILGSDDVYLNFTTCSKASLLANQHLNGCRDDISCGRVVAEKTIRTGSQVSMRRTTGNRIEAVIRDASGDSSKELWDTRLFLDVPVVPMVCLRTTRHNIQILPDETGLRSIAAQIKTLTLAQLVVTAMGQEINDFMGQANGQIAERDHKIRVLENNNRDQDEEICTLTCSYAT